MIVLVIDALRLKALTVGACHVKTTICLLCVFVANLTPDFQFNLRTNQYSLLVIWSVSAFFVFWWSFLRLISKLGCEFWCKCFYLFWPVLQRRTFFTSTNESTQFSAKLISSFVTPKSMIHVCSSRDNNWSSWSLYEISRWSTRKCRFSDHLFRTRDWQRKKMMITWDLFVIILAWHHLILSLVFQSWVSSVDTRDDILVEEYTRETFQVYSWRQEWLMSWGHFISFPFTLEWGFLFLEKESQIPLMHSSLLGFPDCFQDTMSSGYHDNNNTTYLVRCVVTILDRNK